MEQGLAPLIDPTHAIAHNKVMIIDGRTLVTGSFNFTHQAEIENAENLLILKGYTDLVIAYRKDFANHKSHCAAAGDQEGSGRAPKRLITPFVPEDAAVTSRASDSGGDSLLFGSPAGR